MLEAALFTGFGNSQAMAAFDAGDPEHPVREEIEEVTEIRYVDRLAKAVGHTPPAAPMFSRLFRIQGLRQKTQFLKIVIDLYLDVYQNS